MNFSIEYKGPAVSIFRSDAMKLMNGLNGDFTGWDENNGKHFIDLPKLTAYHDGKELQLYTQINDTEWIVDSIADEDDILVVRSSRHYTDGTVANMIDCHTVLRIPVEEDRICHHS